MAEDTEQKPVPQQPRREISRRPVVVGLIGLAAVEAVAGGITWKVLSEGLHKIALAFARPVPTPTSIPPGATLYIYRGHFGGVNAVKWSPDNKRIVSGADDQTAQVWDATTGRRVLIYRNQTGGVLTVAWSPDGKLIASGGGAHTPKVTSINASVSPTTYDCSQSQMTFNFSGTITLSSNPRGVNITYVWARSDGATMSPITISVPAGQTSIPVNDTWTLFQGVSNGTYWERVDVSAPNSFSSNQATFTVNCPVQPAPTVTGINFSVSPGSYDCSQSQVTFSCPGVTPPSVKVWEAVTGITRLTYPDHKDPINEVVWLSDGRYIASGSSDKTVRVWDATTGRTLFAYTGHTDAVNSVAWAPDGRYIASGSSDKTVQVWDATTRRILFAYTGHTDAVNSVAWAPDGRYIASGSSDKTVRVWDATTGRTLFAYTGHTNAVNSVAWAPNGKYIASASSDATVRVWSTTTLRSVLTYTRHVASVNSVAWSSDGKHIASAGRDTTVQVWKAI